MVRDADRKSEPVWETTAPLVLFGIGLLTLLIAAFALGGPGGTAGALIGLTIILALYLPLTVAAMYIVAGIIGVSFGILKTAILKLAAITLFTAAINQVGDWLGFPISAWLVAVAVSFFLFSYFFDLDARDTVYSVVLISVIRFCLGILVAALVAALVAPVVQDLAMAVVSAIKSVVEFFDDLVNAVKDTPWPQAIAKALPWSSELTAAVGTAAVEALPPIKFVFTLAKSLTKINEPKKLGVIACRTAFIRAVEQALAALQVDVKTREPDANLAKALTDARAAPEYSFDHFTFEDARWHPFYQDARAVLRRFGQAIGLTDDEQRQVENQVDAKFVPNLQALLVHPDTKEKFQPFADLADKPKPDKSMHDIARHGAYQRWQYTEKRVLRDEPFALRHVYIETDCGMLTWDKLEKGRKQDAGLAERLDPFRDAPESGGRHNLLGTVVELMGKKDFRDAIVLQGQPGSGKSSFTLRLCKELLDKGLQPIRIELKKLEVNYGGDILEALSDALRVGEPDFDTPDPQFKLGKELFKSQRLLLEHTLFGELDICKYVLILDAWDEVSVGAEEGYSQLVERLLREIRKDFLSQDAKYPVRVILVGRPSEVVMQARFLRQESVVLTVRPFTSQQLRDYAGKLQLALRSRPVRTSKDWAAWSLDQAEPALAQVFERYDKDLQELAKDKAPHAIDQRLAPQETRRAASLDILGLPLLCYLALRLVVNCEKNFGQLLNDPTALQRSLVDLLLRGGKPKAGEDPDAAVPHFKGDDLRKLLRQTAEAITVLGRGEAIPRAELLERLELDDATLQGLVGALDREHVLSRLMISFFFKEGPKELGCEFSHKSFREYLFAEQVVEELKDYGRQVNESLPERDIKKYWKDFEEDDRRYRLSRRLGDLLGPQWLTSELGLHLTNLIGWEIARSWTRDTLPKVGEPTKPLTVAQWGFVRDALADLWDWWAEGVHLRAQPVKDKKGKLDFDDPEVLRIATRDRYLSNANVHDIRPTRVITIDAHLGDGLYQLCCDVHSMLAFEGTREDQSVWDRIDWQQATPAGKGPRRYQSAVAAHGRPSVVYFAASGPDRGYMEIFIDRINGAGYRWKYRGVFPQQIGQFDVDFRADLRGADLSDAQLISSNFEAANLVYANLYRARLDFANLWAAKLCEANLTQASFFKANLCDADLYQAKAVGAQLMHAGLVGAEIREANLSAADLEFADLTNAKLDGANLSSANLSKANFRSATLWRAKLTNANLEGVNLDNADVADADFSGAIVSKRALEKALNFDKIRGADTIVWLTD